RTFKSEGVVRAVMAGPVKEKQNFSFVIPGWEKIQLLAGLASKDTDSLNGAGVRTVEHEGNHLIDSTLLLGPLMPGPGGVAARGGRGRYCDRSSGVRTTRALARVKRL